MYDTIGNVKVSYDFYKETEKKDMSKKEQKLFDIVSGDEDFEEFLIGESDSYYLYNLSNVIHNILEWYDFGQEKTLLEVGSGSGALTGLFCERLEKVTCIEKDKQLSVINATRNREAKNLDILVGDIREISIDDKFDYVTLIGGAEYLEEAKRFLKPGGTVILSANNKFGIRNWAGKEDKSDAEKEFSKHALKEMIRNAGFENAKFFYPVSDYKLPLEIYSDRSLPKAWSIAGNSPSYDKDRVLYFDEDKALNAVIEDGMFDKFANSYLIFCNDFAAKDKGINTVYTKYNSMRKPEFQVATGIVDDGKEKYVVKRPIVPKAERHVYRIIYNFDTYRDNYYNKIKFADCTEIEKGIKFPFISGKGLLDGFDFAAAEKEEIIEKVNSLFDIILDIRKEYFVPFEVSDGFKEIFGEAYPVKVEGLSVSNLDSIFDNFVISDDGIQCIDYEWMFDVCVPVKYIKYRCLQYLYNEIVDAVRDEADLSQFLAWFDFNEDEQKIYGSMEEHFQQHVHGKDRRYFYLNNYLKNTVRVETLTDEIEQKTQHIENLAAEVESREEEIATDKITIKNLEDQITAKNEHIDNQKQEIASKDEFIEHVKTKLDEANDHIAELLEESGKKDGKIAQLEADTDVLNARVENLSTALENKVQEMGRLGKEIAEKDSAIIEQRELIQEYHRALKNPFYGMYMIGKKGYSRLYLKFASEEKKAEFLETRKVGKDFVKYKDLVEEVPKSYEQWISYRESKEVQDETFEYMPKISILVPVYNVLDKHLVPCIESVVNQTYPNWELCLADDCSTWDNVKETLKKYEENPKIKVVYRTENGHISRSTNSALEVATGEFIALLDCDDVLRPNALYEVVKELNKNRELDFIYSDEDKVDDDGNNRHMPHFKPDWSPDTLMAHMYTCHFGVYRKSIADEIGGLRVGLEGSQDYDFTLRFTEKTTADKIAHIAKILYHWRERKESTAGNAVVKPYVFEAAKRAKLEAMERRGLSGKTVFDDITHQYNVVYDVKDEPTVSIVIPSKDNYEVLKRCIDTLYDITAYKNFEVVLVDNGSSDENKEKYMGLAEKYGFRYIYGKMDFNFSKMCNIGVEAAKGEYILLLNDDIEIVEKDWLSVMLGQAQLDHAGAVGAKLLYPNTHNIQHVGVINIENGPVHAFSGMSDDNIYYFGRNRLNYNVIAVTAACLLVKKAKYEEVGGLDENFAVAYNDIDFCMKLCEAGYFNVVRNDIKLLHHESVSRGNDLIDTEKMRRLMNEEKKLYKKHPKYAHFDPFYNENLTQHRPDFSEGYEQYRFVKSKIQEKKIDTRVNNKLECNLDSVNIGRYIEIEGWGYIKGYGKNNDLNYMLYLDGEKKLLVSTKRFYRPDVAAGFPDERNIEFTGFKAMFPFERIPNGSYKIWLITDKGAVDTGKTLEK